MEINLIECLKYIPCSELNYQEWINIGMALKHEGYSVTDWDNWSRQDNRYHEGECEKKWNTFCGSSSPVTAGTIVQMAKDNGWYFGGTDDPLDWDSEIGKNDELKIIDKAWIEEAELKIPETWDPVEQVTTYLSTLFDSSEIVGYVTESYLKEQDGRYLPKKGFYTETAGELISKLNKCGGDIGEALGDYDVNAGAWIRFNPLDGQGVRNDNVTEFRYALVESDNENLSKQNAILRELELPIACLVYSGGKSLHAIVKVDAGSREEYRKRVDYLYTVCKKNGLEIDTQNKNPSRLSRMPGVVRGDKKQYLLDTNIGKSNFTEWKEWIESINDDLPEPENMSEAWDNLPELSPPLIENVLRQGHKMLLAGSSKAGKSFALIELCCALAEGKRWLGFNCAQGKILYVNLELDRASCLHRFKDVYQKLKWEPNNLCNIDIWNLRGKSIPMDKLAPKLIRRAAKKNYIAIIIDPIYKVITGDENSADQMAHFCNQFDKVCTELECAVIYCHHHSKGAQGGKNSMDRASGSGVFARDPDALLDLIELPVSDAVREQEYNNSACEVCLKWLSRFKMDCDLSQDDKLNHKTLLEVALKRLENNTYRLLIQELKTVKDTIEKRTAWRIEGTLREFSKFAPINLWFDFPCHYEDESGVLADINPNEDSDKYNKKSKLKTESKTNNEKNSKKKLKMYSELEIAYSNLELSGQKEIRIGDIEKALKLKRDAVRSRIDNHPNFYRDNQGVVFRRICTSQQKLDTKMKN